MKILLALFALGSLQGCISRAGPYVTNISNDGDGFITVERCMAKFDPWMSTVTNDSCHSTHIRLSQPK